MFHISPNLLYFHISPEIWGFFIKKNVGFSHFTQKMRFSHFSQNCGVVNLLPSPDPTASGMGRRFCRVNCCGSVPKSSASRPNSRDPKLHHGIMEKVRKMVEKQTLYGNL